MEKGCKKHNVLESILDGRMKPRDIPFSLLQKITDDFSEEQRIGDGGFAVVYKGVLQNGEVAVKRIMKCNTMDEKLFRQEVNSLTQVNHQNIVQFLGFCSNTEHKHVEHEGQYIYAENRERLVCFEYINNGSLEKYITDELRGLEWNARYNIIKGICKGLEYLHTDRHMLHMDLKPANILLDNAMTAKITDFGLSRMDEKSQTTSANRFISPGYCAPEYLDDGKISPKCDIYSLGVIIIELVTGRRGTPNINNVLRRWRHRWNRSGKETTFRYHQVAKLIEIGLLCKEFDPYSRPSISKIICDINELESTNMHIDNVNESTIGQISAYPDDDMLCIEPLELYFPFELNKQTSCSLQLLNETNAYSAFYIGTTSLLPYCIEPTKGIVAPRSKYGINITLQPQDKAPQDNRHAGNFIVRSTELNGSLISENITEDMFKEQEGKVVDEVILTVAHEPREAHVDLPLELLTIAGTANLNSLQASNVLAETEPKTSPACTSREQIQFDPPHLSFPFVPTKMIVSSVNMVNNTDYYIGFNKYDNQGNVAWYYTNLRKGIMPPRSTQRLVVKRVEKEKQGEMQENKEQEDKFFLWNIIVAEGVKESDLPDNWRCAEDCKELPIVFEKTSLLCTSHELIQFDPPELRFPVFSNKRLSVLCSVKIVNITDHIVGFNTWINGMNSAMYMTGPTGEGILSPRSTQVLTIKMVPKEKESKYMKRKDDVYGVWNGIVAKGVKAVDLVDYMDYNESKQLPIVFTKTNTPCTSEELIQFDPPELSFPFMQYKTIVFSVNMANNTDYSIGFSECANDGNMVCYYTKPRRGIMPPKSTQRLVVRRVAEKKEQDELQGEDKFFLWNMVVTNGVEASDIDVWALGKERTQLPIVLEKTSIVCNSHELIQFDPPELRFPVLSNTGLSVLFSVKIVNVTDHFVGFSTWVHDSNLAIYITDPIRGILPPRSTQALTIKMVPKKNESEDMQCKDDVYGVWNGIVTKGVEVGDLVGYVSSTESKQLPIVFTKARQGTA